jgi:hypothetical protein
MIIALYWWRVTARRTWPQATVLAVLVGLLGAVILGSVAGARRTETAYGRYLAASNVSDVFVNVPGKPPGMPELRPITLISALPGVTSHAAYLGLNGAPVLHGRVDRSFLTNSVNGILDREWYRQDRLTVLAGRVPPLGSTSDVMLTPGVARLLDAHIGGTVTYSFRRVNADGVPAGRPMIRSYRLAAIVDVPPALVDQSDQAEGSILPAGATRQLLAYYLYAWMSCTARCSRLSGRRESRWAFSPPRQSWRCSCWSARAWPR